jgi:hypothetical protein
MWQAVDSRLVVRHRSARFTRRVVVLRQVDLQIESSLSFLSVLVESCPEAGERSAKSIRRVVEAQRPGLLLSPMLRVRLEVAV